MRKKSIRIIFDTVTALEKTKKIENWYCMEYIVNWNWFEHWTFQNAMKKSHQTIVLEPMHLAINIEDWRDEEDKKNSKNGYAPPHWKRGKSYQSVNPCRVLNWWLLVLYRIKPLAPQLLEVPFHQSLHVSDLWQYSSHTHKNTEFSTGPVVVWVDSRVSRARVFDQCSKKPWKMRSISRPPNRHEACRRPTSHCNVPGMLYPPTV